VGVGRPTKIVQVLRPQPSASYARDGVSGSAAWRHLRHRAAAAGRAAGCGQLEVDGIGLCAADAGTSTDDDDQVAAPKEDGAVRDRRARARRYTVYERRRDDRSARRRASVRRNRFGCGIWRRVVSGTINPVAGEVVQERIGNTAGGTDRNKLRFRFIARAALQVHGRRPKLRGLMAGTCAGRSPRRARPLRAGWPGSAAWTLGPDGTLRARAAARALGARVTGWPLGADPVPGHRLVGPFARRCVHRAALLVDARGDRPAATGECVSTPGCDDKQHTNYRGECAAGSKELPHRALLNPTVRRGSDARRHLTAVQCPQ